MPHFYLPEDLSAKDRTAVTTPTSPSHKRQASRSIYRPAVRPKKKAKKPRYIYNEAPSAATVRKAQKHKIFTQDGIETSLGAVLRSVGTSKVLVIFIRHFFCGNCQEYIRHLHHLMPPTTLPSNTSIIIIGCGGPSLIAQYIDLTRCPYPIFADSSTKLYSLLGMVRSLSLGTRSPRYIQHNLIHGVWKSIKQGISRLRKGDVMKAGSLSVNGGEFLFWRDGGGGGFGADWEGPGEWKIGWCHRMPNSRGHMEVEDLKERIGIRDESGEDLVRRMKAMGMESKEGSPRESATVNTSILNRTLDPGREAAEEMLKEKESSSYEEGRLKKRTRRKGEKAWKDESFEEFLIRSRQSDERTSEELKKDGWLDASREKITAKRIMPKDGLNGAKEMEMGQVESVVQVVRACAEGTRCGARS